MLSSLFVGGAADCHLALAPVGRSIERIDSRKSRAIMTITDLWPFRFQDPRGTATRTGQPPSRITLVSERCFPFRWSFLARARARARPSRAESSPRPSVYRTYLSGEVGAARVAKRLELNDYSRSRGEVNRS